MTKDKDIKIDYYTEMLQLFKIPNRIFNKKLMNNRKDVFFQILLFKVGYPEENQQEKDRFPEERVQDILRNLFAKKLPEEKAMAEKMAQEMLEYFGRWGQNHNAYMKYLSCVLHVCAEQGIKLPQKKAADILGVKCLAVAYWRDEDDAGVKKLMAIRDQYQGMIALSGENKLGWLQPIPEENEIE